VLLRTYLSKAMRVKNLVSCKMFSETTSLNNLETGNTPAKVIKELEESLRKPVPKGYIEELYFMCRR
jgi:hypothetical protein